LWKILFRNRISCFPDILSLKLEAILYCMKVSFYYNKSNKMLKSLFRVHLLFITIGSVTFDSTIVLTETYKTIWYHWFSCTDFLKLLFSVFANCTFLFQIWNQWPEKITRNMLLYSVAMRQIREDIAHCR